MYLIFASAVFASVYSMIAVRIVVFYTMYDMDSYTGNPNLVKSWLVCFFWPLYLVWETIDSFRTNKLS